MDTRVTNFLLVSAESLLIPMYDNKDKMDTVHQW